MLTYWFPPIKTSSLRTYFLYKEFKKVFTSVNVLSTSNQKFLPKEKLPIDENDLQTLFTIDYRTLQNWRSGNKKSHFSEEEKQGIGRSFIIKLLDSFPFNLIFGEGGFFYIMNGFFNGKKVIRKQETTHIFSSFRPYSDHFIAYLLKTWNPDLIWIADFRDLHIDEYKDNVFWKNFQRYCNKKIISKANLLMTVSEGLAQNLRSIHEKVIVVRNGFNNPFQNQKREDAPLFQIAYTGSIYQGKQSAKPLFKALQNLIKDEIIDPKKIKLVYAGKDRLLWQKWASEYNLDNLTEINSVLPLKEAIKIQHQSHINLLLSWAQKDSKGILTGKIYEYLFANKPIIAIVNGKKDEEFHQFFKASNAGLLYFEHSQPISKVYDYLKTLYQEWKRTGTIKHEVNKDFLANNSWENKIKKLIEQLDSL